MAENTQKKAPKINYDCNAADIAFDTIYNMLYDYWRNIAINIYKWKGLDAASKLLTSQIMEEQLFERGYTGWRKDETIGHICLPISSNGNLNIYGKPQSYMMTSKNGIYTASVQADDIVVVKNNSTLTPTKTALQFYCTKLAEIEMTKQLNLNAHKMPLVMETSEQTELTNKNVIKKILRFDPVIFKHTKTSEIDKIDVISTNAQYILDKLEDEYNCYVAKILTLLGIRNYIEDKAERVQSAEVEANEQYIQASHRTMLDVRKEACQQINEKFGLSLSIECVLEKIEQEKPVPNAEKPNEEVAE